MRAEGIFSKVISIKKKGNEASANVSFPFCVMHFEHEKLLFQPVCECQFRENS